MKDLIRIDTLSEQDLAAPYAVSDLDRTEKEILFLHEKLHGVARISLVLAFELGKRLVAVKDQFDHGEFGPWLEENFPFSDRTARRYIQVFEKFQNGHVSVLTDMTLQEAYIEAGVKKIVAPEPEPEEEIHFAGDGLPLENWSLKFRQPPISGIKLRWHRVIPDERDGRVYLLRGENGYPVPVAEIYLPQIGAVPAVAANFRKVQRDIAAAIELYCAQVEELEEQGILKGPEDRRFTTAARKLRGAEPIDIDQAVEQGGKRGRGRPRKEAV